MQSSKTSNKTRAKVKENALPEQQASESARTVNASSKSKNHRKAQPVASESPVAETAVPVVVEAAVVETQAFQPAQQEITHEDIARLAHSFWAARNYQPGSPEEDWLRAEQELKASAARA